MINYLISDLHLEESRPDIAEIFFQLLEDIAKQDAALYILGDFFEAWIGDDDLTPFNLKVISALRKTTDAGIPIYLMHGNRDFVIGKKFLKMTGCKLLPKEYVITINNKRILLMHGDSLCTQDVAYLKFRKKARIKLLQNIFFLWWPLAIRRKKAASMRAKSKAYTSTASQHIMDVTQDEVVRVMKKHKALHLIHGHTHKPDIHHFLVDNLPATRTVLGAWHESGNVLICDEDGKIEYKIL